MAAQESSRKRKIVQHLRLAEEGTEPKKVSKVSPEKIVTPGTSTSTDNGRSSSPTPIPLEFPEKLEQLVSSSQHCQLKEFELKMTESSSNEGSQGLHSSSLGASNEDNFEKERDVHTLSKMNFCDVSNFIRGRCKFLLEDNPYDYLPEFIPILYDSDYNSTTRHPYAPPGDIKGIDTHQRYIMKNITINMENVISFLESDDVCFDIDSVDMKTLQENENLRQNHLMEVNRALAKANEALCLQVYSFAFPGKSRELLVKAVNAHFITFLEAYREVLLQADPGKEGDPSKSAYIGVLRHFLDLFKFNISTPGPDKKKYSATLNLPGENPTEWIAIPDLEIKYPAPATTRDNKCVLFTVQTQKNNEPAAQSETGSRKGSGVTASRSDPIEFINLGSTVGQHFLELLIGAKSTVFHDKDGRHYYRLGLLQTGTRVHLLMLGVSETRLQQLLSVEGAPMADPQETREKNFFRHLANYDLLRKNDRVKFARKIQHLVGKLHTSWYW